ncbi:MAG: R3H domain-containing nucleic acid-binding protein [Candidatus Saccharibacteria bacterium]
MSALEAKDITQKLLDSMGLPATVQIDSDEPIFLTIKSDDSALIIGKGGESLRSVQAIINSIYRKNNHEAGYVGIDINGYRMDRIKKAQAVAQELADKARETGEDQHMIPMNAFERRSVHTMLAEDADIITDSEGDDLDRHIVIKKR